MTGSIRSTLLVILFGLAPDASAQRTPHEPLTLVVNADLGTVTISRHIYGQFAEHLGRGIYDGVWTKAGTGEWHLRDDVIEALKRIAVPNIRWPGGCFADYYHWRDGIGPRDRRPTIVNTVWGGVTEDNSFGTHEFLDLAARIGAEPFIVGNVGSGTVQEMADWWEYVNFPGTSPMADLRRANGRDAPWGVSLWGVGNESWGCGGTMTPAYYADLYRRFQTFLRRVGDVRAFRVATGPNSGDYEWTDVVMREAGRFIDGLDLHYYSLAGTWARKGSATAFAEAEWFAMMRNTVRMEPFLERHSAIMDRHDPRKRVALIVGEWGTWHDVEPGTNPGFLYQQNTLRDAVVAAYNLNLFNNHADRVRGANIAQMVNVLQAMILTQGDRMILTPTYHVFALYLPHHDATLLPSTLEAGAYAFGADTVPAVSASASRDSAGVIHLTLVNLDPNVPRTVTADIRGVAVSGITGSILTASAMNAHNTFDAPDAVRPAPFDRARLRDGKVVIELPPKAVVALTLRAGGN
ncbi:MAG TPA: alpha-L-arabinofuranosidase C-terminal domain-containing protein [Gemmatimonadales bacterium]